MGNIQFTRNDYSQLSAGVQTKLKAIATKDGTEDNLSGIDLAKASKAEVQALITELKKEGYSLTEQKLVDIIFDMTQQSTSEIQNKGVKSYAFEGTDEAVSVSFKKLGKDEGTAAALKTKQRANQSAFVERLNLVDNAPEMDLWITKMKLSDVDYNVSSNVLSSDGEIGRMQKARQDLKDKYNFNPQNPFDFEAVKDMKGKIPQKDIPQFIETYMTAHYDHPGGAGWSSNAKNMEESHDVKSLFFGNPPPLQQLPDGRCLIDCQGYAALAETMFDTLIPGKDQGRVFMMPVRYPGHEMGIMRVGDDTYMVDNNKVNPLPLTQSEKDILQTIIDTKAGVERAMDIEYDLDDIKMSRANFPTLYTYLQNNYPNLAATNQQFEFDEDDALKDG